MIIRKLENSYFLNFRLANRTTHPAYNNILYIRVIYPDYLTVHHLANPQNKEAADHLAALDYDIVCLIQALSKATNCRIIFIKNNINYYSWRTHSLKKLTSIKLNFILNSSESWKFFIYIIYIIFTTVTAGYVPLQRFEFHIGLSRILVDPGILQLLDLCLIMSPITLILIILHITVGLPEREMLHLGFDFYIQTGDLKALSEGICLKNLRVLEINMVSNIENYLARLLLIHKITLHDVYLELIKLLTLESWKLLLKTIQDELCLDHLEITDCEASDRIIIFSGKQLWDSISIQGGKETLNNLIRILILEKII
ncbi:uncharacterized protein BO88DRAFT_427282 [Aspergillus vadensis CBS 113365]|uniref:Uncharacterized protein n=1 Tax=Aspergillus vadensis (strain CBS 113365 / IMI 142717 / IBT 24658) TaxID=1448311 RepID=A0A319B2Z1_ASPVC|nr:hypothetical protein BO88DRAFT_427282 [Aspergillus vadensis CBS 113365]PYH67097.1 hypothetical protein BO88DRAFT_427282 [Aspergillus vadensis CBS 113365]